MRKLCILLTDPMKVLYEKGEIKQRYYNPGNYFDEVHLISFCDKDIEESKVQVVVEDAKLKIHAIGSLSGLRLLTLKKRLLKLIREIAPSVIRAYDPSLRGALAVYIGKSLKLPVVLSIHSHLDEERKFDRRIILRIRTLLERYSLKNADEVVCVSNYVKKYAQKYGAKNITVIYNRVYPEQFFPSRVKTFRKEKKSVVLSVGRLDPPKYQECLIRAIKDLNVKLIIIGNGKLYGHLKKLVENLKIEQKVEFIKSVPNSRIQEYYLSSDIFAIATFFEGFCIPVAEAMAASLPIVASDIEPISEIVGDCAILAKNNPQDFKKAFEKLLHNQKLASSLSEKAYTRVLSFDGSLMEQKEKNIFQKSLE